MCFVTGEPSGLSVTLPKALAELTRTVPPGTRLMTGFDRGGSYASVFAHCRGQGVHWVSYRRAPLAVPAMLPVHTTITVNGMTRTIAWCEETVQIKDYGEARQLTLFEDGRPVLQVLTSDMDACPADLLGWLKSRWREENFLKYAAENYGIDKICDYFAEIEANVKVIANPARKQANAAVRQTHKALADAERALAVLLADPAVSVHDKNTTRIPAAQAAIADARKELQAAEAARDKIPAKAAANDINPDAEVAVLRTGRRGLQMVLRLLAHNAEHWLSGQLNAYLRDEDEYRAITRETIIRGLAGTITWTPAAITVALQPPESRERELPREAFLGLRPRDFGMDTKIRCSTDKTGPERELPPCLSAQWPALALALTARSCRTPARSARLLPLLPRWGSRIAAGLLGGTSTQACADVPVPRPVSGLSATPADTTSGPARYQSRGCRMPGPPGRSATFPPTPSR